MLPICDEGVRDGITGDDRERLQALERENREPKRADEILRNASAFFAQAELDRKPKYACRSLTSTESGMGSSRSLRGCLLPHRPTTRTHSASSVRRDELSSLERIGHGGLTQTTESPVNPRRFKVPARDQRVGLMAGSSLKPRKFL